MAFITLMTIVMAIPTSYDPICKKKDVQSLVGGPDYEVEVLTADIFMVPGTLWEQWLIYGGRYKHKTSTTWSAFVISYETFACHSFINKIISGIESI